MKTFDNSKDCLEYLKTKAKKGEAVILDERATESKPKRRYTFRK